MNDYRTKEFAVCQNTPLHRATHAAGFSLIEVLVAILIIAVLIAIIIPVMINADESAKGVVNQNDKRQVYLAAVNDSIEPELLDRVAAGSSSTGTNANHLPPAQAFAAYSSYSGDGIPEDLLALGGSTFTAFQRWTGDHRFNGLNEQPATGTWGEWLEGTGGRLFIDGGTLSANGDHRGQPFKGWSEYYFRNVTFDGLQWANESNAGSKPGAMINVDFHDVREDAIRDVHGHIENVTIHSARLYPGSHGDTIDWKGPVDGAYIKNLVSTTGILNGIITADIKNVVIDGYIHRGDPAHLSIDIGGDAENVIIRNCKLSGGIRFRGNQTNVVIEWDTVETNVTDW